jgi:23S rRNA pseudouridine2605 synthase
MIEAIGHRVDRLVRVRIGPIKDSSLRPGAWRELSLAERKALAEAMAPTKRR